MRINAITYWWEHREGRGGFASQRHCERQVAGPADVAREAQAVLELPDIGQFISLRLHRPGGELLAARAIGRDTYPLHLVCSDLWDEAARRLGIRKRELVWSRPNDPVEMSQDIWPESPLELLDIILSLDRVPGSPLMVSGVTLPEDPEEIDAALGDIWGQVA